MNARTESIDHEIYRRRVRRVLFITLALNLLVVAGKLIAGLLAGAMSVISDAIGHVTATIHVEPSPEN